MMDDGYKEQLMKVYREAGRRIYDLRNMRGYTREYLAEMSGISAKFLYEIENGKKGFSAGNLYLVSRALQVGTDYILKGYEGDEQDQQLIETLKLFGQKQTESLDLILKDIYKLLLL